MAIIVLVGTHPWNHYPEKLKSQWVGSSAEETGLKLRSAHQSKAKSRDAYSFKAFMLLQIWI